MAKKKLPTSPIRIDVPKVLGNEESSKLENDKLETSNLETMNEESSRLDEQVNELEVYFNLQNQVESSSENSSLLETSKPETSKTENNLNQVTMLSSEIQETEPSETIKSNSSKQKSSKIDSSKTDSGKIEYKKVGLRLSVEAYQVLSDLRNETGIPSEIFLDVMLKNWENLPQRTQSAYIKEAKHERQRRLLAGQQKAMETIQQRLLED